MRVIQEGGSSRLRRYAHTILAASPLISTKPKNRTAKLRRLVIFQFMCAGSLAGLTHLRYTVLTSPKKGEIAVHCCDLALSVLVMLVFRNVFREVSALQSTVFTHFFG